QHAPSIRLHLEMGTDRRVLEQFQYVAKVRLGAGERAEALSKHRNVEMDAPRSLGLRRFELFERFRQIEVVTKPWRPALDDLMQVDVVGEGAERFELFGLRKRHFETCADLDLADADARRGKARHGVAWILELDGHVAGVETHAHMPSHARVGLARA